MTDLKIWFKARKERFRLARLLKQGKLNVITIYSFYDALRRNEVDEKDAYACKVKMVQNNCIMLGFGLEGFYTQKPELKINIYVAGSKTIRIECIYTKSSNNSYAETVTFDNAVDIDHIRDDKPNDYANSMDRITTIKHVICSSMLYTMRNYIKRWY